MAAGWVLSVTEQILTLLKALLPIEMVTGQNPGVAVNFLFASARVSTIRSSHATARRSVRPATRPTGSSGGGAAWRGVGAEADRGDAARRDRPDGCRRT